MTHEEITRKFDEYYRTKDLTLRNDILVHYLYVAEIVAKKFVGRGVDYDDLYQVASMALVRTIERFEPGRGIKFTSFATPSLVGEVKNYFRDKSRLLRISRRDSEQLVKFSRIRDDLVKRGGVGTQEIAIEMNISQERVLELMELSSAAGSVASLEALYGDNNDSSIDTFVGFNDENFTKLEDKEFLEYAMAKLGDTDKLIITERFVNGKSQRAVASDMGVSQMFVSRCEKKALKKMLDLYE